MGPNQISHIPVAVWRLTPPNSISPHHSQDDINLELIKEFFRNHPSGLDTYKQTIETKKLKQFISPTKIPMLVHSSLRKSSRIITNQITKYFLQQGKVQNDHSNDKDKIHDTIYHSDLLKNELEKEERYQVLFTNKNKSVNSNLRGKVVDWIIAATSQFKYSIDTAYTAVFFIDVFLHSRPIKTITWPLLGLTAFHLAGKVEEKSRARLPAIWKKYKNLVRISLDEMQWMEKEILTTLKFMVMPPTPKLFADLAFSSGCITFSCESSESIIKDLSYKVLLCTLQSHEMSSVRASYKAEFAIQVSTEYVMHYHGIFLKEKRLQTMGELKIIENAVHMCSDLLRNILLPTPFSENVVVEGKETIRVV